jgi:peptide/nickel transport system substrate-binding protein
MSRRMQIVLASFCFCWLFVSTAAAQSGGELRFSIQSEPKTFDPMLADDDSSETIRYLTGGFLIRLNRQTQTLEPELATSWKVSNGGQTISFELRKNVVFSDGTPFSADDVAYTMRTLMDPNLHSPTADPFRSVEGQVKIDVKSPTAIVLQFPGPVANLEELFDSVAIVSAKSPHRDVAGLGPFVVAEHKAGSSIVLRRNPNYWKRDAAGKPLPYLDAVHLDIQQNRDLEMLRFRRGEIQLINTIAPDAFDRLAADMRSAAHDAGPSFDTEQMWFNQVASAPIPDYKKAWFRSQNFRRAVSQAINRADMCRIAFAGHAQPAAGMISPANHFWFNAKLRPEETDVPGALKRLADDGFHLDKDVLRDRDGHAVEFSIITNAGNKVRERLAVMMQDDLARIGIRLNVVTLDFPSLIDRISHSFNYEACLLGLVNVDLDPSTQMNVWLSSASNHQWNPEEKTPATPWEVEIDRLMHAQASTTDNKQRKEYFDRVQEIVADQAPFIYLVNKNALSAVSPTVRNAAPVVLRPQTYWNIDSLYLAAPDPSGRHGE